MIFGKKGVTYGLQVPGKQQAPEKAKPSIFGGFAGEDDLAVDRNAAVRAQQGVKRSDAKVRPENNHECTWCVHLPQLMATVCQTPDQKTECMALPHAFLISDVCCR